jgi:hypothetical protein
LISRMTKNASNKENSTTNNHPGQSAHSTDCT